MMKLSGSRIKFFAIHSEIIKWSVNANKKKQIQLTLKEYKINKMRHGSGEKQQNVNNFYNHESLDSNKYKSIYKNSLRTWI